MRPTTLLTALLTITLVGIGSMPDLSAAPRLPRLAVQSFSNGNWDISVWDRSQLSNVTQTPENEFAPTWSADGQLAYLSTKGTLEYGDAVSGGGSLLYVWNGTTTTQIGAVGLESQIPALPVWSRTGLLAYTGQLKRVYVWDGAESIDVLPDARSSKWATWSPDGRLAFAATWHDEEDFYVWDGTQSSKITTDIKINLRPVWSPDGKLALCGYVGNDHQREILVWDGRTVTNVSNSDEDDYSSMAWSDKGKLAWISESGVMVWDGQEVSRVVDSSSVDQPLQWSSDGHLVINYRADDGNNQVALWDGKGLTMLTREGEWVTMDMVWNSAGQLALPLQSQGPDIPNGPGPITITTLTLWQDGLYTTLDGVSGFVSASWSSDDWLAWAAPTIEGDAVGLNKVFVWNGESVLPISSDPSSFSDAPVWEPIEA